MPETVCSHSSVVLGREPWLPLTGGLPASLRDLARVIQTQESPSKKGSARTLSPLTAWIERLNSGFSAQNHNKQLLRFVPQDESLPYPELAYEARIWKHGLIATRANWHDFFNALVWRLFPRTKAALNAVHWREMCSQTGTRRSARRDALTLFDECGLLVLAEQREDLLDLSHHRWSRLLGGKASRWRNGRIQAITFGHALYEKYLQPYVGMTGKALLIQLPENRLDAFSIDLGQAVRQLDEWLAEALVSDTVLLSGRELAPLPVLGIPDWWANRPENFMQLTHYFRPPGAMAGERKIHAWESL